jgi:hypothetical protein
MKPFMNIPNLTIADPIGPFPRSIDYAALERVESVTTFCGMKMIASSDIPDGELHIVQSGRLVRKIVFTPNPLENMERRL